MMCEINTQLSQENKQLKDENVVLIKQVATKEVLLMEELNYMAKIKEELVETKLTIKKFSASSNKIDEILTS
ncbi:hypothetical protein J1N35_037240 [Gossypium stocksii]|uniref:Uncharacterized protein n=1 Tax=Gossypium stocksii TaxID=47602 RepID=A0A9D3ZKQ3_9ROSI|nr:hypothetical protein J1N35_037240 [Gossypium stocksii]